MFVIDPEETRKKDENILPMASFVRQFRFCLSVSVSKYGINEVSEYLCHKKNYEKIISINIAKTNP